MKIVSSYKHLGECITENFESGLFGKQIQDLEKLELHMFTCEVDE